MKTKATCTHVMTFACIGIFASCASPPTETTRVPMSVSLRPDASASTRLFQDVNSYRRSQGESDLQRHPGLDNLAKSHSEYLRKNRGSFSLNGKNVSHIGFEGRALVARERLDMINISENVVAGQSSQHLVQLWKGSKDHHKNLLDNWTHTGIGVVVDSDGMMFATQLFSNENSSQRSTRERFNRF